MAQHEQLSRHIGLEVYFADHPHSSLQRGVNENTSGLLRILVAGLRPGSLLPQDGLDASLGGKCPAVLFIPDGSNMNAPGQVYFHTIPFDLLARTIRPTVVKCNPK